MKRKGRSVFELGAYYMCLLGKLREKERQLREKDVTINAQKAGIIRLEHERDQFKELATRDALTGLFNRGEIVRLLEEQVAHAEEHLRQFCLLMLDIDKFKGINDVFGHPIGDEVIVGVAEVLKKAKPYPDLIGRARRANYFATKNRRIRDGDRYKPGRFGGEEFIVILPETIADEAFTSARAILEDVRLATSCNLSVSISIGIAEFVPGSSVQQLIQMADDALYDAKNSGRDCVVFQGTEEEGESETQQTA